MKKNLKNAIIAIPLSVSMLIPNGMAIYAEDEEVDSTDKIVEEEQEEKVEEVVQEEPEEIEEEPEVQSQEPENEIEPVNDSSEDEVVKYTISFDAGDGYNAPASFTVEAGSTYSMPTETPTANKEGYEFLGWAYTKDGTSKLKAGDTATKPATRDTTYYAVYKKVYKIVYHKPDGSTYENKYVILQDSITSKTGWTNDRIGAIEDYNYYPGQKVIGWTTKEGGTEVEYGFHQSVDLSDEQPVVHLYSVYGDLDTASFNVVVIYKDGDTEVSRTDSVKAYVQCTNNAIGHTSESTGTSHYSTSAQAYQSALNAVSIQNGYKVTEFGKLRSYKYDKLDETSTTEKTQFATTDTYYLIAEKQSKQYTIKFMSHDGLEAISTQTVEEGSTYVMPEAPEKDGYKFMGWAYTKDGTSKLKAGETATKPATKDTTYYAVYKKAYKIIYHWYDGTETVEYVLTNQDKDTSKTTNLYNRIGQINDYRSRENEGLVVRGFTDVQGGTEINHPFYERVTLTDENPVLNLYSVYGGFDTASFNVVVIYKDGDQEVSRSEPVQATVTCTNDGIGHTGDSQTELHASTYAEVYNAALQVATIQNGYRVTGFAQTNAKGDAYTMLDSTSNSKTQFNPNYANGKGTYYLIAEAKYVNYSITYHDDESQNVPENVASTNVQIDTKVNVSSNVPSRENYVFKGWATSNDTYKVSYKPGDEITLTEDTNLDLYPVYALQYTVNFYNNDGSELIKQVNQERNLGATRGWSWVKLNGYTAPEGYELLGWAKESNATSANYGTNNGVKVYDTNPVVNVYAVYREKTYHVAVNFHSNWKDNDASTKDLKIREDVPMSNAIITLPTEVPERDGYKFVGWSTRPKPIETTTIYQPGDSIEVPSTGLNLELYAVWTDTVDYTISFKNDEDTTLLESLTGQVKVGSTATINLPEEKPKNPEGLIFIGWVTLDNVHKVYEPGAEFEISSENPDVVLYAKYRTRSGSEIVPGQGDTDPDQEKKDDTKKDDTSSKDDQSGSDKTTSTTTNTSSSTKKTVKKESKTNSVKTSTMTGLFASSASALASGLALIVGFKKRKENE